MTWLVATLAALFPAYLIRFSIAGIPTTLWEVLLYLVVLASVIRQDLKLRLVTTDPLRWSLGLLLLASIGAVAVSPDLRVAAGLWKAVMFDGLLFYFLLRAVEARDPARGYPLIFDGYLLGATAVAGQAIWEKLLGHLTSDGRVIGIFQADPSASPNYLALYLGPAAAAGLFALLPGWSSWPARFRALAGLLIFAAVILSGSRAAAVAVATALALGSLWYLAERLPRHRVGIWAAGGLVLLVAVGLTIPHFLPNLSANATAGRLASSNNIRWEIWRTTVTTLIPHMPFFGLGWGNFQTVFTRLTATWVNYPEFIAPYALHPHNFFLTTLVTTGWLGLLAWIWILVAAIRGVFPVRVTRIVPGLVFLVWLIHGLVDTTYYKNDLAPLTWLLIAPLVPLAASGGKSAERPNISSAKNSTRRR